MSTRICPYLRTVDDPGVYVSSPDAANCCYALSPDQSTSVELEFQAGTCMGGQFSRCARYKTAGEASAAKPRQRILLLSGGVGVVVFLSMCAVLSVAALALGAASGFRFGRATEATNTPAPIAIATLVPTITPTATISPTVMPTATPTPTPITPTATPTSSPTTLFTSPLATPPPYRTPAPPPTAAPWRPTPSLTPSRTPTRGTSTITPTPSRTPTGTVTSSAGCRSDDTMVFDPGSPAIGKEFKIIVQSQAAYTDVSLAGPKPVYEGLKRSGIYYIWTWRDDIDTAGTYSYSFKIKSGSSTCKTGSVTIIVPTDTPTVSPTPSITPTPSNTPTPTLTPTPTPFYNFFLESLPPTYQTIRQGGEAIFTFNLKHLGNVADTYHIAAEDHTPTGWQVWFCIGDTNPSNCYAPTNGQSVIVQPSNPTLPLFIKAQLPGDAILDSEESIILQVIALSNSKTDSKTVTIRVKN
jgi:hypothetical protein